MFWNSMSDWEKDHIAAAFSFELNMVETEAVRERAMNELLAIFPRSCRAGRGADGNPRRAGRSAKSDALRANPFRAAQPSSERAQLSRAQHEQAGIYFRPIVLNRRTCSVSAVSTGRRSIEEAP